MKILAHTCFIGTTGYANHARSFFTALNKYHTVKIRNLTIGDSWKGISNNPHDNEPYFTSQMKDMLILQTLINSDGSRSDFPIYDYKNDFIPDVHVILMEMNNYYYYDEYNGYKIAFCVYESTRFPDYFFNRLLQFNEVWVPSQWQFDSLVEQGYPIDRVKIVPEGVDIDVFKPIDITKKKKDKFRFIHFGRWDYRKSTTEIIKTFGETFKDNNDVELVCAVENPYPSDETRSTEDRIKKYDINYDNVKFLKFLPREEYVKYLQEGDVFVSCARSEGWNLPLCVPEGKLIFCNDNFMPIECVKTDDIVISHTGLFKKVLKTFKREYDDEIIKINMYGDHELLELTPDHPVYGIKRSEFITKKDRFKQIQNISPTWIESKNIEKGDIIIRTTLNQKYFENEIIDLTSFDSRLKCDDKMVWYNTGYNCYGTQKKYNRFINLWDLSFLFGWYISEGSDCGYKLYFSLNAKKEISIAEKIISEIKRIFNADGTYKIKENNRLEVTFGSVLLCKIFIHFCNRLSFNKKIPEKLLLGPLSILEDLVKNMVLGDGCFLEKYNRYSYTTVSKTLSIQLMFANQRMGIKTSVQKSIRLNRKNRICYDLSWSINNENGRHSNKLWGHPSGFAILVKSVTKEKYRGFVYNLQVDDDNSYLLSNATIHNCESMASGTPTIYSNWGGQLQFAKDKGIPVKISHLRPANIGDKDVDGEYCEPDFEDLSIQMKNVYENYNKYKDKALEEAKLIHNEFNWDNVAKIACEILEKKDKPFVFVTAGDEGYMSIIEKLVESLNEFSKQKIIVYGINCDVPFESTNMIKRRLDPPKYSEHDKWYWKQYACIDSLKENYENFVWIDGDSVANYNIDTIEKYFSQIENYPLSDIHIQEEFFSTYFENGIKKNQYFCERLSELWNVPRSRPYMHVCLFVYNKNCKWWFEEVIDKYKSINLTEYHKYLAWNDETIENVLRWKYGFKKHLPNLNFDVSSYDGDEGFTNQTLNHFYKFWNESGPQNFNRIYGYQFIPENKSNIIWFHGNKDIEISEKIIEFIRLMKDDGFYKSDYFYTDVYELKNFESIKEIKGSTIDIALKYDWHHAVYHEIYNLRDYYLQREKRIHNGDIVVDIGANIGVFTRWAYMEGASKVISFEPDHRYFKLLKLNSDPRTILFNAAISDEIGIVTLYECDHFGGSNIFWVPESKIEYKVRTYTLDYLFETNLIEKIDFLKIDTEGAEINIFKGISDSNLMKVKNIALEYHHSHLNYNEEIRNVLIIRLNNLGFNSHLVFLGTNNALQMLYFWR